MKSSPNGRLQAGFVMEQVLGHVSHYRTLQHVLQSHPAVDPHWVEVTYDGNGRLERTTRIPAAARSTLRGYLQVRQGVRRRRLDALLFHTQKPAVFQWDLLARVPSVLSLDVTPRQYDQLGDFYNHQPDGDTPFAHAKHWLNRRTFALARAVVVWSSWVAESLVADYGVPRAKLRLIPPGVDLSLWTPPAGSRAAVHGLPRILFVGGDFERKGGPLLLDWFRARGRGRCELDLVTRSNVEPQRGVRVHRNVVGNSVEARELFFGADLFVMPSVGECFGIASVEAMAAGLPVVTTSVGGSTDIVQHGRTGFLVEPNQPVALGAAVEQLVDDADLRRSMGERGRARAETHYDGALNAERLVALLAEVAHR